MATAAAVLGSELSKAATVEATEGLLAMAVGEGVVTAAVVLVGVEVVELDDG